MVAGCLGQCPKFDQVFIFIASLSKFQLFVLIMVLNLNQGEGLKKIKSNVVQTWYMVTFWSK